MEDRPSSPSRVWNRIPDAVRDRILALASQRPGMVCRPQPVRHNVRRALRRLSI
ncbi:hypothetical protein H0485_21430 [Pseudogemmobacter sp. CC-YST710]|uniref:Uncharacterized protein n=1 Tax=Pseudogemmobacter faecipullorum TaxID=2755041 RepID=A0ABS8CTG7_9RHOB|nr:hypothetical protein [Pseudogemmobacter faecipullorum]